jgi:SAM-dependent methyltransferase
MSSYDKIVEKDVDTFIQSHSSMFTNELRSVAMLKTMLAGSGAALEAVKTVGDIAGGMGQHSYHLRETFPNAHFEIVDISAPQIEEAVKMFAALGLQDRFSAKVGTVYELEPAAYDVTICWNTMFVLDDADKALKQLIGATKPGGRVLLCTLLNPHDVDLTTEIVDYSRPSAQEGYSLVYRTPSLKRFIEKCKTFGASGVRAEPFVIDIDLADAYPGIGTYTLKLDGGTRIQVSGGMLMNWHIVDIAV